MKKILTLFLCLLLLTSCTNTDVAVDPPKQNVPSETVSSTEVAPAPSAPDEIPENPSAPPTDEKKEAPAEPQKQIASVIVYGLDGEILLSAEKEIYEGMTALDILFDIAKEKNIPVAFSGSKSSAYVKSIGGLAEKQHGGMGGWIYTLNGESIMTPSGKCILSPGDSVEWKYITEF